MVMKEINGGVCAAQGFKASGIHCGVKEGSSPDKNDLALILSEKECNAAAVYTLNRVKAAPIYVTMEHLEDGVAWGVIANSGNANACCPMSHENAEAMCEAAAQATGRLLRTLWWVPPASSARPSTSRRFRMVCPRWWQL